MSSVSRQPGFDAEDDQHSEKLDVTDFRKLVEATAHGEPVAVKELFESIYNDLRRIARAKFGGRADHTLQPTALVHEAYMRLIAEEHDWRGKGHLIAAASRAMRRIHMDYKRRTNAERRGGSGRFSQSQDGLDGAAGGSVQPELTPPSRKYRKISLNDVGEDLALSWNSEIEDLLSLDEALEQLKAADPAAYQVAELHGSLRYTQEETAELLGISSQTVLRKWKFGRAWLKAELRGAHDDESASSSTPA